MQGLSMSLQCTILMDIYLNTAWC